MNILQLSFMDWSSSLDARNFNYLIMSVIDAENLYIVLKVTKITKLSLLRIFLLKSTFYLFKMKIERQNMKFYSGRSKFSFLKILV